jgi:hypothetical protein
VGGQLLASAALPGNQLARKVQWASEPAWTLQVRKVSCFCSEANPLLSVSKPLSHWTNRLSRVSLGYMGVIIIIVMMMMMIIIIII